MISDRMFYSPIETVYSVKEKADLFIVTIVCLCLLAIIVTFGLLFWCISKTIEHDEAGDETIDDTLADAV
ncbi:hypothetical protein QR680_015713 [Steinernema hermaphroditum]|uniref:Uncharacterized protein n=1 Tax=Steinernema hermaphroditum TaxID=289476 RepID=A0AA39H8R7_9BILA|nr:hypothetical protein QR680_015713 [Steinernema hermaphroditum]